MQLSKQPRLDAVNATEAILSTRYDKDRHAPKNVVHWKASLQIL